MTRYIICPSCGRSVTVDDAAPCPECGQRVDMLQVKKQGLVIDAAEEAREFASGKDYFLNTEFLSASERFKKALTANKNSYLSKYFVLLCDIYLNEGTADYDVMAGVIKAIKEPIGLMQYANAGVTDKLNFIVAILNETKIIMINRLRSHDKLYELEIGKYRNYEIRDLKTLLQLFRMDNEQLMTYSPQVRTILLEIADTAIAVCHKTVQTVAIGEELYSPKEEEYAALSSLNSDFCYFASSFDQSYDVKKYVPDFTQNDLLNDKVSSRFKNYYIENKHDLKKYVTSKLDDYNDILKECEKALEFTYLTCFKSLCAPELGARKQLIREGIQFLYRMLTPRITISDKKKPEMHYYKFVEIVEKCNMLSDFLNALGQGDGFARESLRAFYDQLCDMTEMYFLPEYERYTKQINKLKSSKGEDYNYYESQLFNAARVTAVALTEYVEYVDPKDKCRARLVKYCKTAAEEFLMLRDYRINELEHSNIYRPILDIYNAVMHEIEQ